MKIFVDCDVLLDVGLGREPMNDFEDALQCAAALTCDASVIVSRNIEDYQHSPVKTVTPKQILKDLKV